MQTVFQQCTTFIAMQVCFLQPQGSKQATWSFRPLIVLATTVHHGKVTYVWDVGTRCILFSGCWFGHGCPKFWLLDFWLINIKWEGRKVEEKFENRIFKMSQTNPTDLTTWNKMYNFLAANMSCYIGPVSVLNRKTGNVFDGVKFRKSFEVQNCNVQTQKEENYDSLTVYFEAKTLWCWNTCPCFQILNEVEKRRAISPALVQPFMRGIMEAPFPAPGRTITVKNFLPGSGTEVRKIFSQPLAPLPRPLPCPHVSSLSTHRWSSCVDRPIPVWNMWTLNVSSPPSVCVCFYGCLRLFCWNAGSSLQLTSSGWLLRSYSNLTTEN